MAHAHALGSLRRLPARDAPDSYLRFIRDKARDVAPELRDAALAELAYRDAGGDERATKQLSELMTEREDSSSRLAGVPQAWLRVGLERVLARVRVALERAGVASG